MESLENKHVKNVVIGAGMAGLLTAYLLQEQGQEVMVLEADRAGSGQTGRTTAKITAQHGLIYADMIKKAGVERARGYAKANTEAISTYEEIIRRERINCDFERLSSYLYTTEAAGRKKLQREAAAAGRLGLDARYMDGREIKELPFPVTGAVCFEKQAQFRAMKFVEAISKKLYIREHTRGLSVEEHRLVTSAGTLTADNIIFATHYPFLIVPGYYFLRQHQERSYVLALKCQTCSGEAGEELRQYPGRIPAELSGIYYGINKGGLSFRREGKCLLLGGGSHRTGKKICGYDYLREMVRRYYPEAVEVAAWSAQDCMPHDRIPFIGRYSLGEPYWYVATGFQKWGMTSSMVAAKIISDRIGGRENPYGWVFSPQRVLLRAGIKNFCMDMGESLVGLTAGWLGRKSGRCTHMGCKLQWNPQEKSWDCPCHGSRFAEKGELLDGPAVRRLRDAL